MQNAGDFFLVVEVVGDHEFFEGLIDYGGFVRVFCS